VRKGSWCAVNRFKDGLPVLNPLEKNTAKLADEANQELIEECKAHCL